MKELKVGDRVHLMSDTKKREFAIFAAELVLPIFEKKYPDDKRPRNAIDAAKAVLKNDTPENREKARDAAATAYAAANSTAYAATTADSYAAAYAVYAAAYAADAVNANSTAYAALNAVNATVNALEDTQIKLIHKAVEILDRGEK